jgi:hypothetical protein
MYVITRLAADERMNERTEDPHREQTGTKRRDRRDAAECVISMRYINEDRRFDDTTSDFFETT